MISYSHSFQINKQAKEEGNKITSIEFLNKNEILISSNDSTVRLLDAQNYSVLSQYSGARNEDELNKLSFEGVSDTILISSEDHKVYLWKKK